MIETIGHYITYHVPPTSDLWLFATVVLAMLMLYFDDRDEYRP